MPESKKPGGAKRIIDVTHADKTSPSDTSRPVIITNRPILKDPMMSDSPKADTASPELSPVSETTEVKSAGTNGEKVVKPVEAESEPESVAEPETVAAPDQPPTATTAPDQPPPTATSDKTPTGTPPDLSRGELATDPEASDDIEASKRAEHEAAVQKLIDGKQFYLPIETSEHRRSRRFVALGIVLSLVLAVAWVDIALDANLIHIQGVKPPTHFFSN